MQNYFTIPELQPYQRAILDFVHSNRTFRMATRTSRYFAVIEKSPGGRVEFGTRHASPQFALQEAMIQGWTRDEITIKVETPIPGESETVSPETILRERFEKWAAKEWEPGLLNRITMPYNEEPFYRVRQIQVAWEAFQEGAKAVI